MNSLKQCMTEPCIEMKFTMTFSIMILILPQKKKDYSQINLCFFFFVNFDYEAEIQTLSLGVFPHIIKLPFLRVHTILRRDIKQVKSARVNPNSRSTSMHSSS